MPLRRYPTAASAAAESPGLRRPTAASPPWGAGPPRQCPPGSTPRAAAAAEPHRSSTASRDATAPPTPNREYASASVQGGHPARRCSTNSPRLSDATPLACGQSCCRIEGSRSHTDRPVGCEPAGAFGHLWFGAADTGHDHPDETAAPGPGAMGPTVSRRRTEEPGNCCAPVTASAPDPTRLRICGRLG
jgi:hypothetical protein